MILEGIGRLELDWVDHDHLQDIVRLLKEGYPHEQWTRKDLVKFRMFGSANSAKFVTDDNGLAYACVLYSLTPTLCRIRRLVVTASMRRRGLARFMLSTLLSPRGPLRRERRFEIKIHERNLAALKLVTTPPLAFTRDGTVPRMLDEKGDDIYLFTCRSMRD